MKTYSWFEKYIAFVQAEELTNSRIKK